MEAFFQMQAAQLDFLTNSTAKTFSTKQIPVTAPITVAVHIPVTRTQPVEICRGRGRYTCERQGTHSWFNHAQDGMLPGYPPHVREGDPRYE